MFQIIKGTTHIDFISKRRIAVVISTALNLAILVGIFTWGLNFGVDFAGGTLVEMKFNQEISPEEVRRRAEGGGLTGVSVQRIGADDENSFLIRLGGTTQLTQQGAERAREALGQFGEVRNVFVDLENGLINFRAPSQLDPEQVEKAVEAAGTQVYEVRPMGTAQGGGFDYQIAASGMADKIRSAMSQGMAEPDFVVQRVDYVGPQVGKQLRNKGIMALVYAMLAILMYVAFRFDFKFGPGALVALIHDVIMVTGYYLVTQSEFNLTAIAALLTIIGYSINDTIVIYDRIREEMVRYRGKPLAEIINLAINSTLSRTILTGMTSVLALSGLLIFGVGEIWDFAMAMVVGIAVGTYSTIYVASPLTIWIDEWSARRDQRAARGGGSSGGGTPAQREQWAATAAR